MNKYGWVCEDYSGQPWGHDGCGADFSAVESQLGAGLQRFKFIATGLTEWLQWIFMSAGKNQISNLLPRHVRPEIFRQNMLYGLLCDGNHDVGRCEPDATLKRVNVKNL